MTRIKRAYSTSEIFKMKRDILDLDGAWHEFIGNPEFGGTWFVWGNSGNGKTSFTLQLCRMLAEFYPTVYNSIEEGTALTMAKAIKRAGLDEVGANFKLVDGESMEDLTARMKRPKGPKVAVIDSLQYSGLTHKSYVAMSRALRTKLLVVVSHADGNQPSGRVAKRIMYDAALKIFIEGYKAFSKGRYLGSTGEFTIWEDGANRYWGMNEQNNNEIEINE